LLIEFALFSGISGARLSSLGELTAYLGSYWSDLIAQSGPMLLVGFGMTLILLTAGIDLSVGSMVALIACVMSSFPGRVEFWWTAVPAGLLAGIVLGLTNGALISWLDVPPIIATLGTMIFYRGLCFVIMGELEKAPFVDVPAYDWLGQWRGVALLVAAVFAGGGLYFHGSRWRQEILMLGGNRVAARYAGIPVTRRILQVYALMGTLAFLAALSFTARNSSVSASSLTGMELPVIVAVVLGGTRVQGGAGSLVGTFLGTLTIAVLNEGFRSAVTWGDRHLPFKISHLQYVTLGLLLLLSVRLTSPGPTNNE
jgi:ribose transport system permease protein